MQNILIIRQLELLFCTILTIFCNSKIPGLGHHQSEDSGLVKTARISGFGILGLQTLVMCLSVCLQCCVVTRWNMRHLSLTGQLFISVVCLSVSLLVPLSLPVCF